MATTPRAPIPTPPRPTQRPAQPTTPVPPTHERPQQGAPVASGGQVNIHGQGPQPNMAPPEEPQKGLADNTLAEMEAGKKILAKHGHQHDAEHEAGRKHLSHHQKNQNNKPPSDEQETD